MPKGSRYSHFPRRLTCGQAFSLVEVTIALGVFAFAIISLVGLLSVGLQTERLAHQDTAISNIVSYVLSDLRGSKYATITGDTTNVTKTNFTRWYQFDADGAFLLSGTTTASPAAQASSFYLCTAQGVQVLSPKRMAVTSTIQFPFTTPAVPVANRQKQIFVTSIAPYEVTK
ncbi:hypothetical protein BH09VER1_BH09VER1_36210 [soil metagenome]